MNENLNFWRIWDKKDRIPLFLAFFIVLLGILLGIYGWYQNLDSILNWDVYSELNQKLIDNQPFFFQNLQFSSSSNLLYITERYLPSIASVPKWAFYFLLLSGLSGISLLLTGFSRLQGIQFFVGLLFLAILLISMRFENLFTVTHNWYFLGIFGIIGGIQYLFNSFIKNKPTYYILLVWAAVWVSILILFYKFANINEPLLSIAAYGLGGMFILTGVFVFFTAHEAFRGMVWFISQNAQKGKSSVPAYFAVSFIFILNLLLIYFENTKTLDASALIMAPLFLFFINTVLGLWGLKKYIDQTEAFSFKQIGLWIYLGGAIIAAGTVSFIYISGNDPFQELFEDLISIASLVMSLCFFVHVLMNYFQLFKQGLAVHKVIYKSPFSKLFLARTAGFFAIIFLFSFKNYYSYYQFQAGQNNAIADFHLAEGDNKMAETFYKSAANYDRFNHKSNLSLASMALEVGDKVSAGFFYNQSIQKIPNAYAYAGLSSCLENEDLFFESIFELNKGIKNFPENHRLYTNLAYLQAKARQTDSVFLNLDNAAKLCKKCGPEQSNLLAFWIENGKKEFIAEKTASIIPLDYEAFIANKAAINLLTQNESNAFVPKLFTDSALNVSQLAYVLNVSLNNKTIKGIPSSTLKSLAINPYNEPFSEALNYALANQNYFRGEKKEGIKSWYNLANSKSKNSKMYQQNLGLLLFKEGLFSKSLVELEKAGDVASVKLIKSQNLSKGVEEALQKKGIELENGLSLANYKERIQKAPLNPYFLSKTADFLVQNNKAKEAYNLVFYATDLVEHPLIWKANFKAALALFQYEYAAECLQKLKKNIPAAEFGNLAQTLAKAKEKSKFE
jgi:hypothetical protein